MELAVGVAVLLLVLAVLFRRSGPKSQRTRPRQRTVPQPGEIWFVNYPFRDAWTKSKDRPALVVAVYEGSALVRQVTSQDKSRRPADYDLLPVGPTGLPKTSWVRKQPDNVPLRQFRRKTGSIR